MYKYLAELLGTMLIMFVIFTTNNWIAVGAAVSVAVLLGGTISESAAYNPAIAISFYAAGKLSKSDLIPYIILEILGALGAFYIYKKFVNKV